MHARVLTEVSPKAHCDRFCTSFHISTSFVAQISTLWARERLYALSCFISSLRNVAELLIVIRHRTTNLDASFTYSGSGGSVCQIKRKAHPLDTGTPQAIPGNLVAHSSSVSDACSWTSYIWLLPKVISPLFIVWWSRLIKSCIILKLNLGGGIYPIIIYDKQPYTRH